MKYLGLVMALFSFSAWAEPRIEPLRWVDEGYLERQRSYVDGLVRTEFGIPLRRNRSDLQLLNRIIDREMINRFETEKLQALGVVLGDIFVAELGLQWMMYEDRYGLTRAVCVPEVKECLFPVTMISKRAALGAKPDAEALYKRGEELITPYLPKRAWSPASGTE